MLLARRDRVLAERAKTESLRIAQAEQKAGMASSFRSIVSATSDWLQEFLGEGYGTEETMTAKRARKIPAVRAAINILTAELSTMPLRLHRREDKGVVTDSPIARIVSRYPNPNTPSTEYRRLMWSDVFTCGCHATWIERGAGGVPTALWRLDPTCLTVEYEDGVKPVFRYRYGKPDAQTYRNEDIIYMTYAREFDGITAISPIAEGSLALNQTLAAMEYAKRIYKNGGIPPLMLVGPLATAAAMERASEDMHEVVEDLSQQSRNVLPVPDGHELKPMVIEPEKMQNTQQQQWGVQQVSRLWGVPISLLGELSQATYSNIAEEDLKLVKHTLAPWATLFEGQCDLKLLGADNDDFYFKHDMDNVLRGDRKARVEANARAIHTGQLTPNEAREAEDLPPVEGGDVALVQGATVPLVQSGKMSQQKPTPSSEDYDEDEGRATG